MEVKQNSFSDLTDTQIKAEVAKRLGWRVVHRPQYACAWDIYTKDGYHCGDGHTEEEAWEDSTVVDFAERLDYAIDLFRGVAGSNLGWDSYHQQWCASIETPHNTFTTLHDSPARAICETWLKWQHTEVVDEVQP